MRALLYTLQPSSATSTMPSWRSALPGLFSSPPNSLFWRLNPQPLFDLRRGSEVGQSFAEKSASSNIGVPSLIMVIFTAPSYIIFSDFGHRDPFFEFQISFYPAHNK